jgi:hypothetical protein
MKRRAVQPHSYFSSTGEKPEESRGLFHDVTDDNQKLPPSSHMSYRTMQRRLYFLLVAVFAVLSVIWGGLIHQTSRPPLGPLSGISCGQDFQDSLAVIDHIKVARLNNNSKSIKVLCFIMSHSGSHPTRVAAVLETWGSKCDKLVIASNVTDPSIGAVQMQAEPTYENLWNKLNETVHYVWEHYGQNDEYDWFFKIDDDTFLIMENLKFFLASDPVQSMVVPITTNTNGDPAEPPPVVFGHVCGSESWDQLMKKWKGAESPENKEFLDRFFGMVGNRHGVADFLAGGSGYVFNKAYLKEFVFALDSPMAPRGGFPAEDMAHGKSSIVNVVQPKNVRSTNQPRILAPPLF